MRASNVVGDGIEALMKLHDGAATLWLPKCAPAECLNGITPNSPGRHLPFALVELIMDMTFNLVVVVAASSHFHW